MGFTRFLHRMLVRQTMPAGAIPYYKKMVESVSDIYLQPFCSDINKQFNQGIHILDVGTGPGHLPILLALSNPNHQITGLDLSPSCIASGRSLAALHNVGERVKYVCGAVDTVTGVYDLIISSCSLHHWRFPAQMLKNLKTHLTASGQIWLLDDSGDVSEEAREEWIKKVEKSFDAGRLFRTIFLFESRFLGYSQKEIQSLYNKSGIKLIDFKIRDVFFIAKGQIELAGEYGKGNNTKSGQTRVG